MSKRRQHCRLRICAKSHEGITCFPDGKQCEFYIPETEEEKKEKEKNEVFVKCPWCAGTGRSDFDGRFVPKDYSTSAVSEENKCKKCKGAGWMCLSKLRLAE